MVERVKLKNFIPEKVYLIFKDRGDINYILMEGNFKIRKMIDGNVTYRFRKATLKMGAIFFRLVSTRHKEIKVITLYGKHANTFGVLLQLNPYELTIDYSIVSSLNQKDLNDSDLELELLKISDGYNTLYLSEVKECLSKESSFIDNSLTFDSFILEKAQEVFSNNLR